MGPENYDTARTVREVPDVSFLTITRYLLYVGAWRPIVLFACDVFAMRAMNAVIAVCLYPIILSLISEPQFSSRNPQKHSGMLFTTPPASPFFTR